MAKVIEFNTLLEKILAHSHDIKIADIERQVREHRLQEARSAFYPVLSLRFNNEYLFDLDEADGGTVTVGDTVVSDTDTTFQNSASLRLNYTLYDSGVRRMTTQNYARDIQIARLQKDHRSYAIKVSSLSIFSKLLKMEKRLNALKKISNFRHQSYRLVRRLNEAGLTGKADLNEYAVKLAEHMQEIYTAEMEKEKTLHDLSYFSGEKYHADNTMVAGLTEPAIEDQTVFIEHLPEIKIIDQEIIKKQTELDIAKAGRYPKVSLYSSYRLYGSDPSGYYDSLRDIHQRNFLVGMTIDLTLFDGFKTTAREKQILSELVRLRLERKKKIAEQNRIADTIKASIGRYATQKTSWDEYLREVADSGEMAERLTRQKVKDRLFVINKKINAIESRLSIELKQTERITNMYYLIFLSEHTTVAQTEITTPIHALSQP